MAFLKLLATVGLIFTAATASHLPKSKNDTDTAAVDYRLPDNVVPVHYNVRLTPYIEEGNFTFDGEISADIEIRRATRDLRLHALELTIDETATSLVNSDGAVRTPTTAYDSASQILTLNFDDELLPPGLYTLNIKFVGILNDDLEGFFRSSYKNQAGDTVWLATTHFEATSARRAFPCWDEPALKATFNISIKHHRNYTALSNMPVREQTDDEDGTVWTHFDTTPVMSTYLVAFMVADYVRVPNADGTVSMWCPSHMVPRVKFALEIAQISGRLLTEYTNSSDKVPKMDHAPVPEFNAGAMENWGLIIYQIDELMYNEEVDTTSHKHRVAVVVTHEMAHQWFGNVVSPLWWSYVWLNEGFASFFENYILNKIYENWRMMDLFVVKVQHAAFRIDIAKNVMPVTSEVNSPEEIKQMFSTSSYGKAPVLLRMLQHIITEDVFRNGINKYLHTHQFSSATPDNLWSALEAALDESDVPHDAYKLKEVMATWMEQRHYPVVLVTRNYDTGEITLSQEHFRPQTLGQEAEEIDADKWWIPLTFTTQTNSDFSNTLPTHWLRPQDENITIDGVDPNDWIVVNLQQVGYYLVNYDPTNWQRLADYLNSDNYTKIHVLNRAQIIHDAYHLMMAQQLNISIFLDLASYLSRETDYAPWYSMFRIFEVLTTFFRIPGTESMKEDIIQMLNGLIENVGYEENPSDDDYTKMKRAEALKWACNFGHSECRRIAATKLAEHFADPEAHKIVPNLKEWVYCYGLKEMNASTWTDMVVMFMQEAITTSDATLFYHLTCFEDPDVFIKFINMFDDDDFKLSHDLFLTLLNSILTEQADNDLILDRVLAHLETLNSKGVDMKAVLSTIIFNIHNVDRLNKVNDFIINNYNDEEIRASVEKMIKARASQLLPRYIKYVRAMFGNEIE